MKNSCKEIQENYNQAGEANELNFTRPENEKRSNKDSMNWGNLGDRKPKEENRNYACIANRVKEMDEII